MPPFEDDVEVTQEAPADDIRSALMAAMDEQEPATEAVETVERPARARAPDGKFAKVEDAPAAETAPVVEKTEEVPTTTEVKPVVSATEPPANWSEADKAKFKTLPADGQDFLLKRHSAMEADYTRKTQDIAAFRKDFEPIKQMFDPHKDDLARAGYTPATLIQSWYNVERELQAGRGIGIVKSLVDSYKLDKSQLASALGITVGTPSAGTVAPAAPDGQTPAAQLPPEVLAKLNGFEQFIAQQQQERQQQAAQQQREYENRVNNTVTQFIEAKDATGNLTHPHYAEVEGHMANLVQAAKASGGPVPSLDDLYDQAVWANPSTRAKQMEATRAAEQAQLAASEAERTKEARAKAERARRAGSSVTGSPGTGQSAAQAPRGSDSIRAALLAAAEEHEAA